MERRHLNVENNFESDNTSNSKGIMIQSDVIVMLMAMKKVSKVNTRYLQAVPRP